MQISPEQDDAHDFVALVEQSVNGILRQNAPLSLVLIKVDNWFGPMWLGFSGKILGAVGIWQRKLTIPPFVPNRIVSERRFVAPVYSETAMPTPIHLSIPSKVARTRSVSEVAPGAALVWFSGDSKNSGRGSVMAYVPGGESYWSWYVGYAKRESWRVAKTLELKPSIANSAIPEGEAKHFTPVK